MGLRDSFRTLWDAHGELLAIRRELQDMREQFEVVHNAFLRREARERKRGSRALANRLAEGESDTQAEAAGGSGRTDKSALRAAFATRRLQKP